MRSVNKTRKVQHGKGFNPFSTRSKTQQAQTNAYAAQQKAAYNTARSKSRVANVLGKSALNKGNVVYTDKERIAKELEMKIKDISEKYNVDIKALEKDVKEASLPPKTVVDTLKGFIAQLEQQMAAPAAGGGLTEQKAFVITIPYALGQLTLKVLRVALYITISFIGVMALFFTGGGLIIMGVNPFGATDILPNSSFNSTRSYYDETLSKLQGDKGRKPNFNVPNPMTY